MLAGARHSSDQLRFWSHSKSAVVCRCRKCLPRPDWPPGAANHRHHVASLSETSDWPAALLPLRPAWQPFSRLSSTRELLLGRGPVSWLVRWGLGGQSWPRLAASINGQVAETAGREPAGLSADFIYFRFLPSTRPTLASWSARLTATTAPRRAPHGPEKCLG